MDLQFWLGWFDEEGTFVDQQLLEGVDEPEVRHVFDLQPDELAIDSFPVTQEHLEWLESRGIHAQLDQYTYFVAGLHQSILDPPVISRPTLD